VEVGTLKPLRQATLTLAIAASTGASWSRVHSCPACRRRAKRSGMTSSPASRACHTKACIIHMNAHMDL